MYKAGLAPRCAVSISDIHIIMIKFGIKLVELRNLMEERGDELTERLKQMGGMSDIVRKLGSNASSGLTGAKEEIEERRDVFGFNIVPGEVEGGKKVFVIRVGSMVEIQVEELVVGDIMVVKAGDLLAADGLVVEANDLKVNESDLTGEEDMVKKSREKNQYMLARTTVVEGMGKVVITAVGVNCQGNIVMPWP